MKLKFIGTIKKYVENSFLTDLIQWRILRI